MILLERSYIADGSCTIGKLTLPDGWSCYVMENPWLNNQKGESCIPEGLYTLGKRTSPIVQRTSRGQYEQGWEVRDVTGRSFIMIHPGNWVSNTDGCLLPGRAIAFTGDRGLMVTSSIDTFRELMEKLDERESWQIQVTTKDGGRLRV